MLAPVLRSRRFLMMLAATLVGCGETTDIIGTRASNTNVETPSDDVLDTIGMTPEEAEVAIRSAYEQLFFGNPDTQAVYFEDEDGDAGYIKNTQYGDVRTDAIGYGMFITVQLDEQEVFDKLWTWTKRYMLETKPPREGMLRWSCSIEGTDCEPSAATDATTVIATSLFIAEAAWAGTGVHDYANDANMLIDAMVLTEERNGGMVSDVRNLFDVAAKLPRNTSGASDGRALLTDYLMPAFYDYWSKWRTEDAEFWSEAAEVSGNLLRKAPVDGSGLIPRYIASDGTPAGPDYWYDETSARTSKTSTRARGVNSSANSDGDAGIKKRRWEASAPRLKHNTGMALAQFCTKNVAGTFPGKVPAAFQDFLQDFFFAVKLPSPKSASFTFPFIESFSTVPE